MTRLAEFCMLAHGWRRLLLVVLAGAVAGLSMPPFFALPLLFVSFPIWVWALDGAEIKTGVGRIFGPAFGIGFGFGLGYFTVALHWIGAAFFVDGGWFIVLMPFAVLALAAVLSIYWGLASAIAHLFWTHGPMRLLALSVCLTGAEFARGHLFSGFPFDLLGYALTANEVMAQLASVVGVYGLCAFCVLVAASPALIWPADGRVLGRRLAPFFLAVLAIAGQAAWGQSRLAANPEVAGEGPVLRLVQPAIAQSVKWQADSRDFIMERLYALTEARTGPEDGGPETKGAIIWPESAMPFFLAEDGLELARIARILGKDGYLITGAPRRQTVGGVAQGDYNSILVIDGTGAIAASYDKTHLVPIGEYLPFKSFFAQIGLTQFVPGSAGWDAGTVRRILSVGGLPGFLPLICYEAIFSGDLGRETDMADALLNLTNDGWFEGSIGPAQHFHHARLRAIEEGKPLVRVANSGITALVDPFGRITASLAEGQPGVLDVRVPQRLAETIFAKVRHWPVLGFELIGFCLLLVNRGRNRDRAALVP